MRGACLSFYGTGTWRSLSNPAVVLLCSITPAGQFEDQLRSVLQSIPLSALIKPIFCPAYLGYLALFFCSFSETIPCQAQSRFCSQSGSPEFASSQVLPWAFSLWFSSLCGSAFFLPSL